MRRAPSGLGRTSDSRWVGPSPCGPSGGTDGDRGGSAQTAHRMASYGYPDSRRSRPRRQARTAPYPSVTTASSRPLWSGRRTSARLSRRTATRNVVTAAATYGRLAHGTFTACRIGRTDWHLDASRTPDTAPSGTNFPGSSTPSPPSAPCGHAPGEYVRVIGGSRRPRHQARRCGL